MQTFVEDSYYEQAGETVTDKVVYILGAGFSAPLGLPVMSNFLMKSKDMYFANSERFGSFKEVFDTINDVSVSKNYYDADLFNIEEILSILEMRDLVGDGRLKKDFVQYIISVIKHFTPDVRDRSGNLPGNWHGSLFSGGQHQLEYGYFVGNLFGLRFDMMPSFVGGPSYAKLQDPLTSYSVITLNYDMVLESYADYVERNHPRRYANEEEKLRFRLGPDPAEVRERRVSLAKLHGSVDKNVVVPPTWNKALNRNLLSSWKLAFKLLAEANHIRIIGYSLPIADAYVKYLLKAAVIRAQHLKSIDVLCLDNAGEVRERYERFVEFNRFRFLSGSVVDYLETNYQMHVPSGHVPFETPLTLNKLEDAHHEFFGRS